MLMEEFTFPLLLSSVIQVLLKSNIQWHKLVPFVHLLRHERYTKHQFTFNLKLNGENFSNLLAEFLKHFSWFFLSLMNAWTGSAIMHNAQCSQSIYLRVIFTILMNLSFQDLTIQIDPHVSGFLKLPDLLDMMSRIILERNYDAQIEDAFRFALQLYSECNLETHSSWNLNWVWQNYLLCF